MAVTMIRGKVDELAQSDKDGVVYGRIGSDKIKLHRDLANDVAVGDELSLSGQRKNNIFEAAALQNFTRNKIIKIDATNTVLLGGLSLMVAFLCGGFAVQESTGNVLKLGLLQVGFVGGLIIAVWLFRRVAFLIGAASRMEAATK